MFALLLPAQLPRTSASIADEACLTLADSDAPEDIPTDQLERCSTLYPTDVDLIALVGARAEAARQRDAAEAAYRRALALEPGFADLRLRLARLLLARGAAAEAAREARIALETQPNRQALTDLIREADARAAAR
jgi:tetratricopeptide (TPR) repeat protein